jgi:hypothetical protein
MKQPPIYMPSGIDCENPDLLPHWQALLDRFAEGKMSWEQFLQGLPAVSHPALRLASSKDGQTLLHLAVLSNQIDIASSLSLIYPHLKLRRNTFGLTPLELSELLPRKEIASLLGRAPLPSFLDQPNVTIHDPEKFQLSETLEFLAQPLFETEAILDEILRRAKKAKMEDAIPPERIWMGVYYDNEIHKGVHPKVSIRHIDDEVGFGVFADQRIPSCTLAGEYTGALKERNKNELKDKKYCVRYTVWEMGKRQFIIDAENKGNFTRFINHSAKPNLGLQSVYWRGLPRMIFVALKEIPEGAQLTFDYGTFFWKDCKQTPVLFE